MKKVIKKNNHIYENLNNTELIFMEINQINSLVELYFKKIPSRGPKTIFTMVEG